MWSVFKEPATSIKDMSVLRLGRPFAVLKNTDNREKIKDGTNPDQNKNLFKFKWRGQSNLQSDSVSLATPTYDRFRQVWTLFDESDSCVYYTDQDLETIATESDSNFRPMILQRDLIKWRVFRQGYPYWAQGCWNFFEPQFDRKTNKHVPWKILLKDCFISGQGQDKHNNGNWTLLAGKFSTRLPKDYIKTTPIPMDVQWNIILPENPWHIEHSSLIDKHELKLKYKERGLWVVSDIPRTVFLIDLTVRRIMYWAVDTKTWTKYSVRTPGLGTLFGYEFERAGVWLQDRQLFWRDPITLGLYVLSVDRENYSLLEINLKSLFSKFLDSVDAVKDIVITHFKKVQSEQALFRLYKKLKQLQEAPKLPGEIAALEDSVVPIVKSTALRDLFIDWKEACIQELSLSESRAAMSQELSLSDIRAAMSKKDSDKKESGDAEGQKDGDEKESGDAEGQKDSDEKESDDAEGQKDSDEKESDDAASKNERDKKKSEDAEMIRLKTLHDREIERLDNLIHEARSKMQRLQNRISTFAKAPDTRQTIIEMYDKYNVLVNSQYIIQRTYKTAEIVTQETEKITNIPGWDAKQKTLKNYHRLRERVVKYRRYLELESKCNGLAVILKLAENGIRVDDLMKNLDRKSVV